LQPTPTLQGYEVYVSISQANPYSSSSTLKHRELALDPSCPSER
jgi:hypothetical protein